MMRDAALRRVDWRMVVLLAALVWCTPSVSGGDTGADLPPVAAAAGEESNEPAPRDRLVSNSFFETDLRLALSDLGVESGVTIMLDDSVGGYVTLELKDMPLHRALHLMLLQGGFVWGEVEPGVFVVTAPDPRSPSFSLVAETRIVPLRYLLPGKVLPLLPERLRRFVSPDEAGRRLVIEAPEQLMAQILERIEMLDTRPGQVLIEAMVIETSAGALREFDAEFATSHFGFGSSGGIVRYESIPRLVSDPTNSVVRPKEGNIVLGLRWLLTRNKAQLRASPRIIALDGEQAKIEVGTEQYFSILTGSAAYAYTRLEKIDATISLDILPRIIAGTGEVHCVIRPNISDVAGTGEGGLPVITVRRVESTVRLKHGEAVVIGGLIENRRTERERRVPVLSEIPLLGELFKSKRRAQEEREIVILIAPHILDDGGRVQGPLLSDALLGADAAAQSEENAPGPAAEEHAEERPRGERFRDVREAFGAGR